MKGKLLISLLFVFVVIGLAVPTAPRAAVAQDELSVCTDINDPMYDDYYLYAWWEPGWVLHKGEVLTVTAGPPVGEYVPDIIEMYLDGEYVPWVEYPGTLTYRVLEDHVITEVLLIGAVSIQAQDWVPATWQMSCSFAPPDDAFVPGCDMNMNIPSGSVGGTFVVDAPVYWQPGSLASPAVTITAGNSAWVLGQDSTQQYYKIVWACDYLWVLKSSMGPNFDAVWNGAPLPTNVVK